jgi:hypothetical protein
MRLAQEWIKQQQQQQGHTQVRIHHATVSAAHQLHTLELLRAIVEAIVIPSQEDTNVAISNVSN